MKCTIYLCIICNFYISYFDQKLCFKLLLKNITNYKINTSYIPIYKICIICKPRINSIDRFKKNSWTNSVLTYNGLPFLCIYLFLLSSLVEWKSTRSGIKFSHFLISLYFLSHKKHLGNLFFNNPRRMYILILWYDLNAQY